MYNYISASTCVRGNVEKFARFVTRKFFFFFVFKALNHVMIGDTYGLFLPNRLDRDTIIIGNSILCSTINMIDRIIEKVYTGCFITIWASSYHTRVTHVALTQAR